MEVAPGRYNEAFYEGRRASVHDELVELMQGYNFSSSMISMVENYYGTTPSAKNGDVLKVTSFVTNVLEKLGYSTEKISEFLNRNRRIVLASYGNFISRLAVFHQFDLLEPVITKYYGYLGSDSNINSADLFALLSSGVEFDTLSDLREIHDRMSLADRKQLRDQYPLTQDMLREFMSEMMSYVKVIQGMSSLRKLMEQRRAEREQNIG